MIPKCTHCPRPTDKTCWCTSTICDLIERDPAKIPAMLALQEDVDKGPLPNAMTHGVSLSDMERAAAFIAEDPGPAPPRCCGG